MFGYTNSTFPEHDVQKLHGRMLNWVGSEYSHSACFEIFVEGNVFKVTKSSFVVF